MEWEKNGGVKIRKCMNRRGEGFQDVWKDRNGKSLRKLQLFPERLLG